MKPRLPPDTGTKLFLSDTSPQPRLECRSVVGLNVFRVMLGELLIVDLHGAFGSLINLSFNKIREAVECPWAKGNQQQKANKGT